MANTSNPIVTHSEGKSPPLGVLAAFRKVDNLPREDEAFAEGMLGGGLSVFQYVRFQNCFSRD